MTQTIYIVILSPLSLAILDILDQQKKYSMMGLQLCIWKCVSANKFSFDDIYLCIYESER